VEKQEDIIKKKLYICCRWLKMVINWRDTVYLLEFSESWISSSVLPLVSGTSLATNSIVAKLAAENMKNVPVGTQQH
jgi:hypothetical protein